MNRWFVIRLVGAALSLGSGFGGYVSSAYSHGGGTLLRDWGICGIICGGIAIVAFCAVGIGYRAEGVGSGWTKPSWYQNPFRAPSQPLQGLHFIAVSAIAEGIGGVLSGLAMEHYERLPAPNISSGLILATGLGFWVGLR